MTNHTPLSLTLNDGNPVSLMMQYLGRLYVRRINCIYYRTGTLLEGPYQLSLIDSDQYVLACYRYIESNPVIAKMVASPVEFRWSSYQANAQGIDSAILTAHPRYKRLTKSKQVRLPAYSQPFDYPGADSFDTETLRHRDTLGCS